VPTKRHNRLIALSLKRIALFGSALLVAGFLSAAQPGPQTAKDTETCGQCHEDAVKGFLHKPHAAIGTASCTSCHAGAEKHIQEGGGANIFAFKSTDPPAQKNKACLKCHSANSSQFMAGPHGKASLDCTTCHSVHVQPTKPNLLKASATKTCAACHEDIMAKFVLNERHRLQEGILTCTTCHNPHAPEARERLGGFNQEACLKCHTDKGGPFLYEHGASRVEGCTIGHETHGSPNRHMLTSQSVPDLCFGCHVFAPQWHSNFNEKTTNCTNCHTTIHGSNLSKIFIK
jgi:DmsE family decaheme c-type cytochrome